MTAGRCCTLVVTAVLLLSVAANAQIADASCTFKLFDLNPSDPTNPTIAAVNGVNKWGTTVGETPGWGKGFIRYSGGFVQYFQLGVYGTHFNARNDSGITVGYYTDGSYHDIGLMLQGSTVTSIIEPSGPGRTEPSGINKWNSIVGVYLSSTTGLWTGFKLYSNGSFADIMYPGSASTYPYSINDSGAVVGYYYDRNYVKHGFIWHNGTWAILDSPDGSDTVLLGISNSGIILGVGGSGFFLYANGAFELLPSAPNSSSTSFNSMSATGVLTGTTNDNAGQHGFTASCQ